MRVGANQGVQVSGVEMQLTLCPDESGEWNRVMTLVKQLVTCWQIGAAEIESVLSQLTLSELDGNYRPLADIEGQTRGAAGSSHASHSAQAVVKRIGHGKGTAVDDYQPEHHASLEGAIELEEVEIWKNDGLEGAI
ncbi:MAG: hypothetical protein Q9223_006964 [Gallowayella weberi]